MNYKVLSTFDSKGKRYITDSILEELSDEKATQLIELGLIEGIAEKPKTKTTKSETPATSKVAGSEKTSEGADISKESSSDKSKENNKETK